MSTYLGHLGGVITMKCMLDRLWRLRNRIDVPTRLKAKIDVAPGSEKSVPTARLAIPNLWPLQGWALNADRKVEIQH